MMDLHTMWKGSISFGLVHIPIKLFAATEEKDIKMRHLHRECHTPIKYEKVCPACEKEIEQNEIVKGYEYEQGRFVLLEKEELDELAHENNKTIEIMDFVNLEEIDPIYFNKSYFMGPSENGEKAYMLLLQAMKESEKIGIAKITLRAKEHLAVVRGYEKGLIMETIYYPDEVRNANHVPGIPENIEVNEKELAMAKQLIEQLTTEFDPTKYTDQYRATLMDLIQGKITGNEIKVAKEVPQTNIVHLMDALQASIEQIQPENTSTPAVQTAKKKGVRKQKITS